MSPTDELPADFLRDLDALESSYLASSDPILQSGFGGGPERWRAERSPLLDAVNTNGTFLDVGCANGFLLESSDCHIRLFQNHRPILATPRDTSPEVHSYFAMRGRHLRINLW
jgi:hypothetical protein